MKVGDIVVRVSYGKDITFKIIDIKDTEQGYMYTLKGINLRIIADSLEDDLEVVAEGKSTQYDQVFNRKVNTSIKRILINRGNIKNYTRSIAINEKKDLSFGRPGKILHIDGDAEYLDVCLKVYKQLALDVVGKVIPEKTLWSWRPERA